MNRLFLLPLLFFFLLVSSCQKVIDIDLNSADPKLVIECLLSDSAGPCLVKLTRTVDYFDAGVSPMVSGARVIISDNLGNTEQLTESQPGHYVTQTTQGVSGRTYFLNITVDGETYSAQSTMANSVPIDTAFGTYYPPSFGGQGGYVATGAVYDPATEANYYRQRIYVNGVLQDTSGFYFIADDVLSNGRYLQFPLFPVFFNENDTVTIEMWLLNKEGYDFFQSLIQIAGGTNPSQAAPGNPVSMISGDALGYFIAAPVVRKTFIAQ